MTTLGLSFQDRKGTYALQRPAILRTVGKRNRGLDTFKRSHPQAAKGRETFPEYFLSAGNMWSGVHSLLPPALKSPTFQCLGVWQSGRVHFLGGLD